MSKFKTILLTTAMLCMTTVPLGVSAEDSVIRVKDNEDTNYLRGYSPRVDGIWHQYTGLDTALRKNIVFSDVITPSSEFTNYKGDVVKQHDLNDQTAENYDSTHNHYQNVLSEVSNFSKGTNAISFWGDASAVVNGSNAWGGFLSARSGYKGYLTPEFQKYVPKGVNLNYNPDEYDAQLVGLEIDVLNGGKPGVWPNKAKTGLQVVGFGNPNSHAIWVASEDTERDTENRRGLFESGMYFKNSMAEYGRLIVADFDKAKIGLDFRKSLFTEGAMQLKSQQVGTGILYNEGKSGEIYGGLRWNGFEDKQNWLSLRAGEGGLRVVSQDNTKELMSIDNHGGIYLNGDVYINGKKLNDLLDQEERLDSLEKELEELKKMIQK